MTKPNKILVVRNDKIGDFMLAWPSFALLKQTLPESRIHALVPSYTAPLAELCDNIDDYLLDPGPSAGRSGIHQLTKSIRERHFDAAVTLFSTGRIAEVLLRAKIPYRLAPATKVAQFLYNHREKQRRSKSEKPEWVYNLELVQRFLSDWNLDASVTVSTPYLSFPTAEIVALRKKFCGQHGIPDTHKLLFIHPGSGGSANNLSKEQYIQLACNLVSNRPITFVVSAGPGEHELAQHIGLTLSREKRSACIYTSTEGLVSFTKHISFGDLFIGGSTGPLHIAGALNLRTAGFYPRKRSSTPLRWQTLSAENRRLEFTPQASHGEADMSGINIALAARQISERFLQF